MNWLGKHKVKSMSSSWELKKRIIIFHRRMSVSFIFSVFWVMMYVKIKLCVPSFTVFVAIKLLVICHIETLTAPMTEDNKGCLFMFMLWSFGSWIYNYLCNRCISPLKLWWGVPDTTLCDKVCQWVATGQWFSLGTLFSSTIKLTATI